MKYLLFNGVVAAALIYLIAGDKIDLRDPFSENETAEMQPQSPQQDQAKQAYQQTVIETAKQVATVIAERVAKDVAARTVNESLQKMEPSITPNSLAAETPPTAQPLKPIEQVEFVETTPPYVINEAAAVENTPSVAPENKPATQQPTFQLADGEQFMSPRNRQIELDNLAQNMEFLFLSTQ